MLTSIDASAPDSGKLAPLTSNQCAEAWNVARKDTPGFRESVLEGPHGKLVQLEVSSWVQVPYVLQRLHSSSMRVVFPDSNDPEQIAIRDFLRSSHAFPVKDMLDKLASYIDSAPSFNPLELPPPGVITCAADWIAAHEFSDIGARRLTVTEVLKPPPAGDPRLLTFRDTAVEALSSGRPVIFTMPPNSEVAPIAAVLKDACTHVPDLDSANKRATVWLPHAAKPNEWTTELPLKEFLQRFDSSITTSTTTGQTPSLTEVDIPKPLDPSQQQPPLNQPDVIPLEGDALLLNTISESIEDVLDLSTVSHDVAPTGENSTPSTNEEATQAFIQRALHSRRDLLSSKLEDILNLPESTPHSPRFKMEQLEGFYTNRLLASAPSPIGEQTEVSCVSEGKTEQASVAPGQAASILERCCNRSFEETAEFLFEAHEHLHAKHSEDKNPDTSVQEGYLVTLPKNGKAIFVSDLEGDVAKLVLLIDQYNLIERWQRNEPIFLCILGDSVDRSTTGSLLVEFLLELKIRCGFSRQVIILPGNHELDSRQNFYDHEFFKTRKPGFIGDLFGRDYPKDIRGAKGRKAIERLHELCPEVALSNGRRPPSIDEDSYKARWGLYTLFHDIFWTLPRSIVSDNGLFASHAAFPMHGPLQDLFQEQPVSSIDTDKYRSALANAIFKDSRSLYSLMWGDLSVNLASDGEFVPLTDTRRVPSSGRIEFSQADFERFCNGTGTSLMIRGHQSQAPDSSCALQALEELCDREGLLAPDAWASGNIVTVERHATWSALLDLSVSKPEAKDVEWIGLTGKGRLQSSGTHANGRPLPESPKKLFCMVTPQV